ncbi:MAG: hypothetical protein GX321_01180 [Clostridiales bacterium]|nr:hypothetical protein [Clostridiales bacterium]
MKTKSSDIAVKIFLVVVAVILVGLIIAWTTGVFKDKKSDLDKGTERINSAITSMAEFDLLIYDGGTITGSLLLDLIDEKAGGSEKFKDIVIEYKTLAEATVSPAPYPSTAPEKTNARYINPNGLFEGTVIKNENDVIKSITFTQIKR